MIEPGKYYSHHYNLELVIEVIKLLKISRQGIDIYARFWNRGCGGRPWLIDESTEPVRVSLEDTEKWKEIPVEEMVRPRF